MLAEKNHKPRVLIFIVAYNAAKTISTVLRRIPASLADSYEIDVLIIDDASHDATFERGHQASKAAILPFPVRVLFNPVNQGYGGNQKLGYQYAIENDYDFVALLHGDGQYAPECLPMLLEPLREGRASAVFGSRMMTRGGALKGGMPFYKYIGNTILTTLQNKLLKANLTEFHSGYRLYSVDALKNIPFERNSNDFHFDTEIIIQLLIARRPIVELPIPTYYGDEICHVNGLKYAWNVVAASIKARMQDLSLFYDPRFDCAPPESACPYKPKLDFPSPHTYALERVRTGSRVLDLGCAGGYMSAALKKEKRCYVSAVDMQPAVEGSADEFRLHNLNDGVPKIEAGEFDYVLLLDVIEHLSRPESFLVELRQSLAASRSASVIISTANVACLITRLMLMFGQFNYGQRGILDLTHTRLFTFRSLQRALEQSGFTVCETTGVPAPFPLAIGDNFVSRLLLRINQWFIHLSRGLFAYQIFMKVKPLPTVQTLLREAEVHSRIRAEVIDSTGTDDAATFQLVLSQTLATARTAV